MTWDVLKFNDSLKELERMKIAFIVFILLCVFIGTYNIYFTNSLRTNFIILPGKVTEIVHHGKSGPSVEFVYFVRSKWYKGSILQPTFIVNSDRQLLVGKRFPVLVDSNYFWNSTMLIDSMSFINYGLKFPDSIRWIQKYLK